MTTTHRSIPERSEHLFDELCRELTTARGSGERVGHIARELLCRDRDSNRLIGVRDDGELAFWFDVSKRKVMRMPLAIEDSSGFSRRNEAYLGTRGGDEQWVRETSPELWAWLHPRYRWVMTKGI